MFLFLFGILFCNIYLSAFFVKSGQVSDRVLITRSKTLDSVLVYMHAFGSLKLYSSCENVNIKK